MAENKQRAWYIDKLLKIGIVEKAVNAVTKDGQTSDWDSISEAKDLRIYAISRDADLVKDEMNSTWTQIPEQFHEVIVNKVIAQGYKDPRHMELNTAQYFDQEYAIGIKRAKKYSRSNYQSTGFIKQQDF
tara:strand:- start:2216 stop:2605 length:390 start_codon:yes stop_codon:yes gene_type:complete